MSDLWDERPAADEVIHDDPLSAPAPKTCGDCGTCLRCLLEARDQRETSTTTDDDRPF